MRNPGGYAVVTSPEPVTVRLDGLRCEEIAAGISEFDTFTCCHCNCVVHVRPRDREEFFCRSCMKRICSPCANYPCMPFLKKLEHAEARGEALRSYGFDERK